MITVIYDQENSSCRFAEIEENKFVEEKMLDREVDKFNFNENKSSLQLEKFSNFHSLESLGGVAEKSNISVR
jgi:hypothetical protein